MKLQTKDLVVLVASFVIPAVSAAMPDEARDVARAKMMITELQGFDTFENGSSLVVTEKKSETVQKANHLPATWFEVRLDYDTQHLFEVTGAEQDACGSMIYTAVEVNAPSKKSLDGSEKMELTLADHRTRICKDDHLGRWEADLTLGSVKIVTAHLEAQGVPAPIVAPPVGDPR